MNIFFTTKTVVFLYNCKEIHETRDTKDLNKRSVHAKNGKYPEVSRSNG